MEEGNFYKPTFEDKPKNIEEYKERANPILQEHGQQIVKKSQYQLIKYGLIILGIFCIGLLYLVATDKFKTEIPPCPTLPPIPECKFPEIPDCNCPSNNFSCGSLNCNFPTNLSISIKNNTG